MNHQLVQDIDHEYSVLMSVYKKESPQYFKASLESIFEQTVPPGEVILVCDGPLTEGLEEVIQSYRERLTAIRLKKNVGLGAALSEGLKACRCGWIARMDSDDIAVPERCELQIKYLKAHPEVDALSGTVAEFSGNAVCITEAAKAVTTYKELPQSMKEIKKYIKYRNPLNHPCVMFRKEKVIEAGGYVSCDLFEDYDLWARMFQKNAVFANLPDVLLYMRVNNMHRRRGGIHYIRANLHFWRQMYQRRITPPGVLLFTLMMRILICMIPNEWRKRIYERSLRRLRFF